MRGRRDLLLIVGGASVSTFGSTVTYVVIVIALSKHGPYAVSAALIAELLPVVLLAPLAGRLVDRVPNRMLLCAALGAQAVAVAGVAVLINHLPAALVLLFVLGAAGAVTTPAAMALLPHVTGDDDAGRGYAWLGTGRTAATLLGSLAASVLVTGPGVQVALLVDAATFAGYAALILAVRADRIPDIPGPSPDDGAGTAAGQALAGLRHLRRNPLLGVPVVSFAAMTLAAYTTNAAEIFFITDVLHARPAFLGVLGTCWGVGIIGGTSLAGRLRTGPALTVALAGGGLAMGAGVLTQALVPLPVLAAGCWVVAGFGLGLQTVAVQTLTQLHTPDDLRGRVFAANNAGYLGGILIGSSLGAPLVALSGPRVTFFAAGAATLAVALAPLLVLRRPERR
jgi:MFS family permease